MSNNDGRKQKNRKITSPTWDNGEPKEQPPVFRSATMAFQPSSLLNAMPFEETHRQEKRDTMNHTAMASMANENNFNVSSKTSSWVNPTLQTVGLYYPLAASQRRFHRNQLEHVLETLVRVFYALSLHTQYEDQPISALCESIDQILLEVQVWGARDHPDEIILEVSRKNDGDCYTYHMYAHRILSAFSEQNPAPFVRPAAWNMETLVQADSILGEEPVSVEEALETSVSMLASDRYDARKLGFQSLMHMTDPCKSGWSTSKAVAESILSPSGNVQETLTRTLVRFSTMDPTTTAAPPPKTIFQSFGDYLEEDGPGDDFAISAEADFAYLSLAILSQTLRIAARDKTQRMFGTVQTFLDTWCLGIDLVGSMIEKVGNVQNQPHHCYYAVQCLAAMYDCDRSLSSRIRGAHVEEAQLVGESSHLALAKVSEKLLVSLQA